MFVPKHLPNTALETSTRNRIEESAEIGGTLGEKLTACYDSHGLFGSKTGLIINCFSRHLPPHPITDPNVLQIIFLISLISGVSSFSFSLILLTCVSSAVSFIASANVALQRPT